MSGRAAGMPAFHSTVPNRWVGRQGYAAISDIVGRSYDRFTCPNIGATVAALHYHCYTKTYPCGHNIDIFEAYQRKFSSHLTLVRSRCLDSYSGNNSSICYGKIPDTAESPGIPGTRDFGNGFNRRPSCLLDTSYTLCNSLGQASMPRKPRSPHETWLLSHSSRGIGAYTAPLVLLIPPNPKQ